MNINDLTFDQLVELKNEIVNRINSYDDGFFYICKVRSYGRNWNETHVNPHTVQELCYYYFGDNGIVDVYTNNPNLNIENYGDVMYVKSIDDFNKWMDYVYYENNIPHFEKDLIEWNNRENVPFGSRPLFEPIHTSEDIDEYKKKFLSLEGTFEKPYSLKKYSEDIS